YLATEDFSKARADFGKRLLRLAADMPKDHDLPALAAGEVERTLHGAETDVAFAHLGARFGIRVATNQDRRAAGQIGQGVQAGNSLKVLLHWQLGYVGVVAQDAAGKGHDFFSGNSHGISPYSSVDNVR